MGKMWKIVFGIVLIGGLLSSQSIEAGYVWNTDGALNYSGLEGNWMSDTAVSGKVIRDCDVTIVDTAWNINGEIDGHLTVENASVRFQNRGSVRLGTSSEASLTIGAGGMVYCYTDDGPGQYGFVDVAASGNKATINILEGGSLEVLRNYFGNNDVAGSDASVVLNVAGGSLAYVGSSQYLRLGWHNPAEITISKGGTIASDTAITISESGNASQHNPSSVTFLGESYLHAATRFTFGTKSTGGVTLAFLANGSGMGSIQTNTFLQGAYGTVILGVDHAMSGLKQSQFPIVNAVTLNGWQEKTAEDELWNTRAEGGEVVAFLNPARRHGGEEGTLSVADDWIYADIAHEIASKGWLQLETGSSDFELELQIGGLEDVEAFVDWYNASDSSLVANASEGNKIYLTGFTSDFSIFAWDFSAYEPESLSLLSVGARNVPEPATWAMFLGMIGWLLGNKIQKKRGEEK